MKKNIKDYLHLYIGCEVQTNGWGKGKLKGIDTSDKKEPVIIRFNTPGLHGGHRADAFPYSDIKIILRPLSDMNEEEARFIFKKHTMRTVDMPMNKRLFMIEICKRLSEQSWLFVYLLKQGFDLFNLIPENLAIDSTKQDSK